VTVHARRVLDRTARTAIQALAAYLITANTLGGVEWNTAALAVLFAAVTSLLQGIVDLPALPLGWGGDVLGRALRTFAQTALGSVAAVTVLTDLDWGTVLSASALAALTSVVTSAIATPVGPRGTPELFGPSAARTPRSH